MELLIFNPLPCPSLVHSCLSDGALLNSGDWGIFFGMARCWRYPSPFSVQHISEPLLQTASQAAKCLPAGSRGCSAPKLGQVWASCPQVWLHHPYLNFMYQRGKSPPCTSLTFQPSSFRHGLAQRFNLSSAFFHLLEGQNLAKPL